MAKPCNCHDMCRSLTKMRGEVHTRFLGGDRQGCLWSRSNRRVQVHVSKVDVDVSEVEVVRSLRPPSANGPLACDWAGVWRTGMGRTRPTLYARHTREPPLPAPLPPSHILPFTSLHVLCFVQSRSRRFDVKVTLCVHRRSVKAWKGSNARSGSCRTRFNLEVCTPASTFANTSCYKHRLLICVSMPLHTHARCSPA